MLKLILVLYLIIGVSYLLVDLFKLDYDIIKKWKEEDLKEKNKRILNIIG